MPWPSDYRILVCLATYNERENLPDLVEQIQQHAGQADILVIDDNSPDGTGTWCEGRAAVDSRFHCIRRAGKLGLGTAAVAGMRYAIEHNYDLLLTMDADFSHLPEQIPDLVAAVSAGGDVAVGSRYVAGGRITGWPWRRRVMSRIVNLLARTLLRLPTRDNSGQFRCYRVRTLRQIDLSSIRSPGYSFFEEILWLLQLQGAQLQEVPIHFVERCRGRSKLHLQEAIRALRILLVLGADQWKLVRSTGHSPKSRST